jgi:hypothetical protein
MLWYFWLHMKNHRIIQNIVDDGKSQYITLFPINNATNISGW